jgi:hypothetical protein
MDISSVIGPVDVFQAAVAIGLGISATIVVTTALARTSGKKLEMDYKLALIKQEQELAVVTQRQDIDREVKLGQIIANKEVEVKRIENHMVDLNTVKSRGSSGGD